MGLPRSFSFRPHPARFASEGSAPAAPAAPGTAGQPSHPSFGLTALQQELLSAVKAARSFGAKAAESQRRGVVGRALLPDCAPVPGLAPGWFIHSLCPRGSGESQLHSCCPYPRTDIPSRAWPPPFCIFAME